MNSDFKNNYAVQPVSDPNRDDWTTTEPKLQPWKEFWPPDRIEDPTIWQKSEFPEVASWKFDPDRPFDRPWRQWTRTSRAKTEKAGDSSYEREGQESCMCIEGGQGPII
jgi:hypothetical protein